MDAERRPDLIAACCFGSSGRGDEGSGSDLDVTVTGADSWAAPGKSLLRANRCPAGTDRPGEIVYTGGTNGAASKPTEVALRGP